MTPLATTTVDRWTALVPFGYTPDEAQFLTLAALHGGYFLRRQIVHYAARREDVALHELLRKALEREHASASTWDRNVTLYHLYARPLYAALGEPNNRNRRRHELAQIKRRVMALDFVLNHLDAAFLATERDKRETFASFGIPHSALPQRSFPGAWATSPGVRFFVDKDPIYVSAKTPTFAFIDEGQRTLSRFDRFLTEHATLFEHLHAFRVIYVAERATHVTAARDRVQRSLDSQTASAASNEGTLHTYFDLRQRIDNKQFGAIDREDLLRLRDARERFSGPDIEARYARWRAAGGPDTGLEPARLSTESLPDSRGFDVEILSHDYSFLDHFPRA